MKKDDRASRAGSRSLLIALCLLGGVLGGITVGVSSLADDTERSGRTFWAGAVMVVFSLSCFVLATRKSRPADLAEALVLVVEGRGRAKVLGLATVVASVCVVVGLVLWSSSGNLRGAWLLWHPAWVALLVGFLVERERRETKNRALLLLATYADDKCDAVTRDAIDAARAESRRFDAIVREHLDILGRCRADVLASGAMEPRR